MTTRDYKVKEFTEASLKATKVSWLKMLKADPEDFNRSNYERKFETIAQFCDYTKEQFWYGIFHDGEHAAVAVAEYSYTKASSKWVKMLSLHLNPQLDLSIEDNTPNFSVLAQIFTTVILGTLELTKVHTARTVKLYARSKVLLSFFEYMAQTLPPRFEEKTGKELQVKISVEGRWLVFIIC